MNTEKTEVFSEFILAAMKGTNEEFRNARRALVTESKQNNSDQSMWLPYRNDMIFDSGIISAMELVLEILNYNQDHEKLRILSEFKIFSSAETSHNCISLFRLINELDEPDIEKLMKHFPHLAANDYNYFFERFEFLLLISGKASLIPAVKQYLFINAPTERLGYIDSDHRQMIERKTDYYMYRFALKAGLPTEPLYPFYPD